jgi:hypothetical protein
MSIFNRFSGRRKLSNNLQTNDMHEQPSEKQQTNDTDKQQSENHSQKGENIQGLLRALKDEDRNIRLQAVIALSWKKETSAVDALITALSDEEDYVRWNAVEGLGRIRDEKVIDPLIEAMKDKRELVQIAAAKALRQFANQKTLDAVKNYDRKRAKKGTAKIRTIDSATKAKVTYLLMGGFWAVCGFVLLCYISTNSFLIIIPIFIFIAAAVCINSAFGNESGRFWRVRCPHCGDDFTTTNLRHPQITPTLTCPFCKKSFRW